MFCLLLASGCQPQRQPLPLASGCSCCTSLRLRCLLRLFLLLLLLLKPSLLLAWHMSLRVFLLRGLLLRLRDLLLKRGVLLV